MNYRIFLPSDSLVKTAQSTLQALAIVASLAAIFAALALAGYILIWLCGVLVAFIHAFSSVCHAAFIATGSSPLSEFIAFVVLVLITVKFACLLFPSLLSFFRVQEGRV